MRDVGKLDLQAILAGSADAVEFLPAVLIIDGGDYNAPKTLTEEFQVIGVTGLDDPRATQRC
jgi:hypothetical protein